MKRRSWADSVVLLQLFDLCIYKFSFLLICVDNVDSTTEEKKPELYVESTLYIDGAPFGLSMRTRFHLGQCV